VAFDPPDLVDPIRSVFVHDCIWRVDLLCQVVQVICLRVACRLRRVRSVPDQRRGVAEPADVEVLEQFVQKTEFEESSVELKEFSVSDAPIHEDAAASARVDSDSQRANHHGIFHQFFLQALAEPIEPLQAFLDGILRPSHQICQEGHAFFEQGRKTEENIILQYV
jgi:hypothetical protein